MSQIDSNSRVEIAKVLATESSRQVAWYRRNWFWLISAGLLIATIIFFIIYSQNSEPVKYLTEVVKRGDLTVTVSATGTLAPVNEVEVGIEVSGTIKTVYADYNDRVSVGQILARLDTTRLEAQAMQSEAALAAAQAKVLQAEADLQESQVKLNRLQQARELSGGKTPSKYDLDSAIGTLARAKAELANAKASVKQAQGALNVNRIDIVKAVIRSPINGVVLERSVEPGQTVASTFQAPKLFKLAEDLTKMELRVDVDEADVGVVQEGQAASFTVDAYPERTFPARITQVRYGSETVAGVVTYKTVLEVDNSTLSLRPGMTATALITVNKKQNVLLIANKALRFAPPEPKKANEKTKSSVTSVLFPRPPTTKFKPPAPSTAPSKEQQVWSLVQGQLKPITISKGLTDNISTEVVSGAIQEGMELVVGTETAEP